MELMLTFRILPNDLPTSDGDRKVPKVLFEVSPKRLLTPQNKLKKIDFFSKSQEIYENIKEKMSNYNL